MMNKTEFIKELTAKLKYLPAEDREDAILYYTEYIEEMNLGDDEDVSEKIGQPKDVAKAILSDVKDKHISQQKEKKSAKGSATVAWLIVLGLLSAPLSVPLGIVLLAVGFALAVVVLAVFLAFSVTAIALVVAGLLSIVAIFQAPTFAQGFMVFGVGLVTIGLGVLLGLGLVQLVKLIFKSRKKSE